MVEKNLVPKKIVEELDKYIVSQDEAKRNVAVSLRNRYRRKLIKNEILKNEITPKNIILIGATGVGKTEIARRLAKITNSPFLKVEATKYTEVGYVGRNVESMIKDLVVIARRKIKEEKKELIKAKYLDVVIEKVAEKLKKLLIINDKNEDKLLNDIKDGIYDQEIIEIDKLIRIGNIDVQVFEGEAEGEEEVPFVKEIILSLENKKSMTSKKHKKIKVNVKDAIRIISNQETNKNLNFDEIDLEAIKFAEEEGIIFIDEIDKIVGSGNNNGNDVSRQGVQRDILPILEGTTVMTNYGLVRTDHILFIAAGAFSETNVSDLIPEIQGRFPIVTNMEDLTEKDFIKILTMIDCNLIEQYKEMLLIDNVELKITKGAIDKIAEFSIYLNENEENIGARRLATILEFLLKDIMFEAPFDEKKQIIIDKKYVEKIFKDKFREENLDKYIL